MDELKATWAWIYKAPLPAVLGLVIFLTVWVIYTQDALRGEQVQIRANQSVLIASDTQIRDQLKDMSGKMDTLIAIVIESQAQRRADLDAAKAKGGR